MQFTQPVSTIVASPSSSARTSSQGLYGEPVTVLKQLPDFYEIINQRDGYRGFTAKHNLSSSCASNSNAQSNNQTNDAQRHWINLRSTPLFTAPDFKSPVTAILPFGSEIAVADSKSSTEASSPYVTTDTGHFVWKAHTQSSHNAFVGELVNTAQQLFSHTPYLWGGRSPLGIDCSGLVQMCAFAHGHRIPRDSGDQEKALTQNIDYPARQRNDLVYWPGHVAILIDSNTLFHATAFSLSCCVEPLQALLDRAGMPSSIKRLKH